MSNILRPGEKAPELQLATTDGRDLSIGGGDPDGFSTLIMFVSPDCPVCDKVLPAIKAIAREERAWLRLIFAGDGSVLEYNALRDRKGLEQFPFVISAELGLAYAVAKLPYGVVIDEHGIVASHGLTNSREHIESLLEAKRTGMPSIQEYVQTQAAAGVDALFAGTKLPGASRNG
jgi:methylamine dehydrogenase accessory protein MauD